MKFVRKLTIRFFRCEMTTEIILVLQLDTITRKVELMYFVLGTTRNDFLLFEFTRTCIVVDRECVCVCDLSVKK